MSLEKSIDAMVILIEAYRAMKSVDGHNGRPYDPRKYIEFEKHVDVAEERLKEAIKND